MSTATRKSASDIALERGLPANPDAERFVLGSILLTGNIVIAKSILEGNDFSLEKHRRIFQCMIDLDARGVKIDCVTLAQELIRLQKLESVDGFSYLVSLDDGLPQIINFEDYCHIVKNEALKRKVIFGCEHLIERCLLGYELSDALLTEAQNQFLNYTPTKVRGGFVRIADVMATDGLDPIQDQALKTPGLVTGFRELDDLTGGLQPGEVLALGARPSMGKTALMANLAYNVAPEDPGGHCVARNEPACFGAEVASRRGPRQLESVSAPGEIHQRKLGFN